MHEEAKTARLDTQLPEPVLALVQRAASLQGRTLSEFVICSAREAAERAITQHEVVTLSVSDQQRFAERLLDPQPVAAALERAVDRRRELVDPP